MMEIGSRHHRQMARRGSDCQRRRGSADISGCIGIGRCEAAGVVRQFSGGVAPRPRAVGRCRDMQRGPVGYLTVLFASAVPVSVRVLSFVIWSLMMPLSVENATIVGTTALGIGTTVPGSPVSVLSLLITLPLVM